MKRDLELVRKILFAMEESENSYFSYNLPPNIEGYSYNTVIYHMRIMAQADLLFQDRYTEYQETTIRHQTIKQKNYTENFSISWKGHEFLDTLRDEKQWKSVKNIMAKAGGFVLDIAIDVAKELIRRAALGALQ